MRVKPIACIRPAAHLAAEVAALPYDVYDRAGARAAVEGRPLSFLAIDRPETQFPPSQDMYAPEVYAKARELLDARLADDTFVEDVATTYYLWRLEAAGRAQTGFVALCSVDEYLDGTVKKHENTRPEKELDRIRHIEALDAQTGPIFLTFRPDPALAALAETGCKKNPFYSFTCEDGVTHTVWRIDSAKMVAAIEEAFSAVPCAYIADGHHRAASGVKVALKRREGHPGFTGDEPFNWFLGVLFPADELAILPYNRAVRDLGTAADGTPRDHQRFMSDLCRAGFTVTTSEEPVEPAEKGVFGMYLGGSWWTLHAPAPSAGEAADPVSGLDASVLQERLLAPVLGIADPRSDERITFVGGVHGTAELERLVDEEGWAVAFSMHPTAMDELLAVADAGLLMPPKSTWFEPKLRSGLFIHRL